MVSSSKILTVSYGTFSCTAEGFDDPLAVVKDTTQFFRGVVGEDRFFGAEPPQFDPELATELMREQLGARHGTGTVSLGRPGAASSGALAAALSAGPARARSAAPALPDDDTIEATAVLSERPLAETPVAAGADDGLTAALFDQPLTEAVAQPDPGLDAAPAAGLCADPEATAPLVDAAPDGGLTPAHDVTSLANLSQPEAPLSAGSTDAIAPSADMGDTPQTAVEAATPIAVPEAAALVEDAPAPRSSEPQGIAAKLDRIRAVVAGNATAPVAAAAAAAGPLMADSVAAFAPEPQAAPLADDASDWTEAEPQADADAQAASVAQPTADAQPVADVQPFAEVQSFDEVRDAEAQDDTGEARDWDEVDDTALTALLDEFDSEAMEAETEIETPAADDADDRHFADSIASLMAGDRAEEDSADASTPLDQPAAVAAWDMDGEDDRQPSESFDDAEIADAPATAALFDGDDRDEDFGEDDSEDEDVAEAPVQTAPKPAPTPIRARVVKVKRADFERAVASGALEEVEDDPQPAQGSSLSDEEEAELARELAAVKAELSAGFEDWDDEEEDVPASASAAADYDDEDEDEPRSTLEDRDDAEEAFAFDDDLDDEDEDDNDRARSVKDDEDEEDDFDARLTAAAARAAAVPDQEAAPLRLDNPVSRPNRDWGMDIDALDAKASAALGKGTQAEDEDLETEVAIDEAVRDSARKAVKMASPARAMLTEREVADQDTSRLIDQTNSEMDEPEGNRRRSAIAHLRAAVAATKADRLLGRKAQPADEEEAYREDLASVVRPRRPQAPSERTERPAQPAAPLKLVAEQRVAETPAPAATPQTVPIRPRRVRRAAEAPSPREMAPVHGIEDDASGFAAYAESVGAADLPDLLEAAAAYMSYVEGRDQFSRPQLMTTVRQAEVTESSREDRLRSFGQLLREGKIRKTTGGRFTASERISFRPDREAV